MLIVAIESPFKPSAEDIKKYAGRFSEADLLRQNLVYARLALKNALERGEAPLASHLLYTQVWSETPELRDAGIKAGLEIYQRIDLVAFYVDLGRSAGMKRAEQNAELWNVDCERRAIIDTNGHGDARDVLQSHHLGGFPFLEELEAAERGSVGRIRASRP